MAANSKNARLAAEALDHLRKAQALIDQTDAKDAKKRVKWSVDATAGFIRHTERRIAQAQRPL